MVTDLIGAIKRDDIRMTLDLAPVLVPAVKASPLSLIVNELVGDAVRRGLSQGGNIHVIVKPINGHFTIRVEDTSDPLEPNAESAEFGKLMLEASARQVDARIERHTHGRLTTVDVTLLIENDKETKL